jgi:glucose/arabinose dehydrogenase
MRTTVAEWRAEDPSLGRGGARQTRVLLEISQPYANHNAGQLAFGPDGMLYIGVGDGGKRADPLGHGQNLGTLPGSMLRIDVNGKQDGLAYRIPPDNPFVDRPGARPEIWAYGLRNPWRFGFDPLGRLIVADVGQDAFEEIDIVSRGANLGWPVREASHCFGEAPKCTPRGFVDPVFEYGRDWGKSITGGKSYAGKSVPWLVGRYVFADYVSGAVWALRLPDAGKAYSSDCVKIAQRSWMPSTFGRDEDGELYLGDFASGDIWVLTGASP